MSVLETWTEPRPIKLTATDFLQLADAGAFQSYGKTELIEGVIVCMNAHHSTHALVQGEFFLRLAIALRELRPDLRAAVEGTVALSSANMPQPDILVTSYRGPRAPIPIASVPLIVEIADTTAGYDRRAKASIYAAGGVPEYWVVDIEAGEVARFWAPAPGGYTRSDAVPFGGCIEALTLSGLSVPTDDLLPS